jgi:hypothetical protein
VGIIKMSESNIYGAVNGNTETGYPKSDANGSLSPGASTTPKDDCASVGEVFAGDDLHYQTMNPKVTQAIRVVKEYCAVGRGAKKAEDGHQALEHTRAVRMTAQNVGEEDIKNVRTVLGANDIHAANMMDIDVDAMGFRTLRGIRMRPQGAEREKKIPYIRSEKEKGKKQKKMSKKEGPTVGFESTWV